MQTMLHEVLVTSNDQPLQKRNPIFIEYIKKAIVYGDNLITDAEKDNKADADNDAIGMV